MKLQDNRKLGLNKNYMSIAGFVVREQRFFALAFVVRGQDNACKSATAYSSERYNQSVGLMSLY